MVQSFCKLYSVFTSSQAVFKLDSEFSSWTVSFQVVETVFMLHIVVSSATVFLQVRECFRKFLSYFQV